MAWALGELGGGRAAAALSEALSDDIDHVRGMAAQALGKVGNGERIEGVIRVLNDADSSVRFHAAGALGKIGSERAVGALILALKDESHLVRLQAAVALGTIGADQAIAELRQALSDVNSWVRLWAAWALGKIGDERAAEVLNSGPDGGAGLQVAWALGKISDHRAADNLILALNDWYDHASKWRKRPLGTIGTEQAIEVLVRAIVFSPSKQQAASALGEIGKLEVEVLEKLLQLPKEKIYDPDIFTLARKLAVRFSKKKVPFIPVYPEAIGRRRMV